MVRKTARFSTRAPFVALLTAVAFLCASRASDAARTSWLARAAPLRVMALGDSITAGVGEHGIDTGSGGYRAKLVRLLEARGYRVTMVGGRTDYSARIKSRNHEGWPGYVIRSFPSDPAPQLYGRVTREALAAAHPDVILLMAGTNDLLRKARRSPGYSLANIVESMNAELAQIFYLDPSVDVIVAGVVDSPRLLECDVAGFDGTDDPGGCAPSDGGSLKTLVADYAARGFHVALADGMGNAVPRDKLHFPDGIHPTGPDGYDDMARVWMQALENVTQGDDRDAVAGR
jgi:lysophospholipase L1-like esterase